MRVERILAPRINNHKTNGNYKCNQAIQFDSVSFGKKDDETKKPSFREKVLAFFNKSEPLSPEEERSEEIQDVISSLKKQTGFLRKDAKYYHSYLDLLYKTGRADNFNMLLMGETKRVLFGEISPQSNLPKTVTVVDMKQGMQIDKTFSAPNGFNSPFVVKYNFDENTEIELNILGIMPLSIVEKDTDTKEKRMLMPTKNGFYFVTSIYNEDNDSEKKILEINYDPTDWSNSFYMSRNDEGEEEVYRYNPKSKMWSV